jgi:biopolymer transport protein TolR
MSAPVDHRKRGRKKLSHSSHGTMHELNITPLMDLVMVLLVIFMITTPQLSNDLDLNLPSGKAPKTQPKDRPKVNYVDVDANGGYKVNSQPVTRAEMPVVFREIYKAENTNATVVIRGADSVDYQHVITVIDLLQRADIIKVGLATAAMQ